MAILEDYKLSRQQREEEKRRHRVGTFIYVLILNYQVSSLFTVIS